MDQMIRKELPDLQRQEKGFARDVFDMTNNYCC